VALDLARIPAGRFVMGDAAGAPDEQPVAAVEIKKPFWMGAFEITNEQYAKFDPAHDSRFEHKGTWKFEEVDLGWALNAPRQPVVRVSWQQAMQFCQWLGAKAGVKASLPTEAQWEYACRAGSATPFWYGDAKTDFSTFANLGDASLRALAYGLRGPKPPDLAPRDDRFNDGVIVTGEVGIYKANPWGLFDMHGNAWEWTRSAYQAYPYVAGDGREAASGKGMRVVRGGSWNDRPQRCTSAYRLSYLPWQRVYNVGFRVVIEDEEAVKVAAK
jgi:formylglycine-generating enzyme required for sulfatase activity